MKTRLPKWLYGSLSALLFCLPAWSAPPPADEHRDTLTTSESLSLGHALAAAILRNPDFQMLRALDTEVSARYIQAQGTLPGAPSVMLRHQNDAIGSARGEREWEVELELPVWLPGQKAARQALADTSQAGLASTRQGLQLQVAGLLRDAIWDIHMNKNQDELADQRLHTAEALLRDVEKRYAAGELARTDTMLAQQEVLQAKAAAARAEAELQHAQYRYRTLTGLDQLPASPQETQAAETTLDRNALLQEAEAKIAEMQSAHEVMRLERRDNPQLLVNARTQRGAFDALYNHSIGFAVRIPFSSEIRSAPLMADAEMKLTKAMAARDRLRLELDSQLHEAQHNLEVTRTELDIAREHHAIAAESLRLAHKAFALGESDLVNLLRAQATAFEAERALRDRSIQLQWHIARYNQVVGVLP